MADNTQLNLATTVGDVISSDDLGSVKVQRVKVQYGVDGSATDVSASNPLPTTGVTHTPLFRYLDTVGDGTGTKDAIGNYSGAEEEFFIAPPAGTVYQINRLIVEVRDGNGMRAEHYGTLGAALTNGIEVQTRTGVSTTVIDLSDGLPITTNAEWGGLCFDAEVKAWGAGDDFLLVRWTFASSGGNIRLDGDSGERLAVILNDDLTGLGSHTFMAQGYIVSETA